MNKIRIPPPATLQWKTRPRGRIFCVRCEGVRRSSRTSKTHPCGWVFDVQREGYGRGPAGHKEHVSGTVFHVQREGGVVKKQPNIENTPMVSLTWSSNWRLLVTFRINPSWTSINTNSLMDFWMEWLLIPSGMLSYLTWPRFFMCCTRRQKWLFWLMSTTTVICSKISLFFWGQSAQSDGAFLIFF